MSNGIICSDLDTFGITRKRDASFTYIKANMITLCNAIIGHNLAVGSITTAGIVIGSNSISFQAVTNNNQLLPIQQTAGQFYVAPTTYPKYSFTQPMFLDGGGNAHTLGNVISNTTNVTSRRLAVYSGTNDNVIFPAEKLIINTLNELEQTDGSLTVSATNGNIILKPSALSSVIVDGNLYVNGTQVTVDSQTILVDDNIINLSNSYITEVFKTGGLTINYFPQSKTATLDTVGTFVAGVPLVSNPRIYVTSRSAGNFSVGDIVQISNTTTGLNEGLYEILNDAGGAYIEVRGIGITDTILAFPQRQLTSGASAAGGILKHVRIAFLSIDVSDSLFYTFGQNTSDVTLLTNQLIVNVANLFQSPNGTAQVLDISAAPNYYIKGLTAGTGISITEPIPANDEIFITNTSPASSVTLASAGGNSLINDGVGAALVVKGLTAGNGITINSSPTELTINNTSTVLTAYGELQYNANPGSGYILGTTDTFTLINTTPTLGTVFFFTSPSGGVLRYVDTISRFLLHQCDIYISNGDATDYFTFELRKNGSTVLDTFKTFLTNTEKRITLRAIDNFIQNDTLSVYVKNSSIGLTINTEVIYYNLTATNVQFLNNLSHTNGTYSTANANWINTETRDFRNIITSLAHPNITIQGLNNEQIRINANGSYTFAYTIIGAAVSHSIFVYLNGFLQQTTTTSLASIFNSIILSVVTGDIVHFTLFNNHNGTDTYRIQNLTITT